MKGSSVVEVVVGELFGLTVEKVEPVSSKTGRVGEPAPIKVFSVIGVDGGGVETVVNELWSGVDRYKVDEGSVEADMVDTVEEEADVEGVDVNDGLDENAADEVEAVEIVDSVVDVASGGMDGVVVVVVVVVDVVVEVVVVVDEVLALVDDVSGGIVTIGLHVWLLMTSFCMRSRLLKSLA